MGASCTKIKHPEEENVVKRKNFANFREFLSAKLKIRKRTQNQPAPRSTQNGNEDETEVIPFSIASNASIVSGSQAEDTRSISSSLNNDQQELELIDLEYEDTPLDVKSTIVVGNRKRRFRPSAATGNIPVGPMLPMCVDELNNDIQEIMSDNLVTKTEVPVSATSALRSAAQVNIREEPTRDIPGVVLPGEVMSCHEEVITRRRARHPVVSRPQLTVPGIQSKDQRALDNWIRRQTLAEICSQIDNE